MFQKNSKPRLAVKWIFVFSILSIWTFFVVQSVLANGSFTGSATNTPIYFENEKGVTEKVSMQELIDFLFNHNFDTEFVDLGPAPDNVCSVRAKDGSALLNEEFFGDNNNINFHFSQSNDNADQGSLTAQYGRKRFSSSFDIIEITYHDNDLIEAKILGEVTVDRKKQKINNGTFVFDRLTNKLTITGLGVSNFEVENMEVTFVEGCDFKDRQFWKIINNGKLEERRSIDEVRALLNQHPEFIDNFEQIRRLFQDYWWLIVPTGIVS